MCTSDRTNGLRLRFHLLRAAALTLLGVPTTSALAQENNYLIGAGIYDVTGVAGESTRFGYADPFTRTNGIRDRQFARAFIVDDNQGGRVVFVSVDQGAISQAEHRAIVDGVRNRLGTRYNDANIIVSATHTHVASGGHSHYRLYQIADAGFYQRNFSATVDGVVEAVARAHANVAPGRILISRGQLFDASVNRSLDAFMENPESASDPSIDPDMTVLRFIQGASHDVGMVSWFAVHAVSLNNGETLLSSDNKGFAEIEFERMMGADYGPSSFVAAFAQGNAGDMSPNLSQPPAGSGGEATGPGASPVESMEIIGTRQLEAAWGLYWSAVRQLVGPVVVASRYADFSRYEVDPRHTLGRGPRTTCPAALGYSFAAGTEDGRSPLFPEGATDISLFWLLAGSVLTPYPQSVQDCHYPKPILLATGSASTPWTPEVLPVTLARVGPLGILAAPAEFTVQAGRRAMETVLRVEGTGIDTAVFAGYSDAYSGYVTTFEEYQTQQYEGASTHFGPDTLGAYLTHFDRLAMQIANPGVDVWEGVPAPQPRDLAGAQASADPPVLFDDKPFWVSFGAVVTQAHLTYRWNDTVSVTFWGGHPANDRRVNDSYLRVQQLVNGAWVDVALDRDVNTTATWSRVGPSYSQWTITWNVREGTPPGSYRIVHDGAWKSGWTGLVRPYRGSSRTFTVVQ